MVDVNDYIRKKYGLGEYGNEQRQQIAQASQPGGLDYLSSALAGVSAGFMGKDPVSAQQNVINSAQQRGQQNLANFDRERSNLVQDIGLGNELQKMEREDASLMEETDPNSESSKIAKQLASKLGYKGDVNGLTADQFKKYSPALQKMYEIEQKKIENALKKQAAGPVDPFKKLPKEKQIQVEQLAGANAKKTSIVNQINSDLKAFDEADDTQKVAIGRRMLKTLNSVEGPDAIGVEEAARLGSMLEFAMGNLTNSNPMQWGRNLKGFREQAGTTANAMQKAIAANQQGIDQAYGRESVPVQDVTKKTPVKKMVNKNTGQTKIIYSDGSEEII